MMLTYFYFLTTLLIYAVGVCFYDRLLNVNIFINLKVMLKNRFSRILVLVTGFEVAKMVWEASGKVKYSILKPYKLDVFEDNKLI